MENLSLWQETADELGLSLEDLMTLSSYETSGSLDPRQKGPTTQWGQHRGLIQFGEPQAKQYGVDFSSPEAALRSQLGRDGAIVRYMRGSGFKKGMSGLDAYSTINAGAPGRYSASDANNGGASGDVRDKWENQMDAHRAKARRYAGLGGTPLPQAGPTQVRADAGLPLNTRQPHAVQAGLPPVKPKFMGKQHAALTKKLGINDKQSGALGDMLMNFGQDMIYG